MARCELTGKETSFGHNVSHSQRKTSRTFLVNIQRKSFASKALGVNIRFKLSSSAIKSIDKAGGLDEYLLNARPDSLSVKALDLRKKIASKNIAVN